ncbi:hypothetical protein NA57DRAFT_51036 [Rhizodiscina lignyota]|uniref:DUF6590 domain-containing protein n=1 Tax=Rhizodiscina lignyota TaxID=1504668 RepID=A0A9P4ITV8_9PEZI|nr:hypothetical protein NA57DRAFT_51036 [Rhizodiscina lignyota]
MSVNWHWDPTYQQYRIWLAQEGCWVFQNGQRLPAEPWAATQQPTYGASEQHSSADPRLLPSAQYAPLPTAVPYSHGRSSSDSSTETRQYNLQPGRHYESVDRLTGSFAQVALNEGHDAAAQVDAQETSTQLPLRDIEISEHGTFVDENQYAAGLRSYRKLKATDGEEEGLDPRDTTGYRRREGPKFFTIGKVFKILWPELLGDDNSGITVATEARFKQPIGVKIRWFVVVTEGSDYCLCLPVQTYGRRGISKKDVIKEHHAIIYASSEVPKLQAAEKPKENEDLMQHAIRVKPFTKGQPMDSISRLNYGKIYTIEHNVKVFEYGEVHHQYKRILLQSFYNVWNIRAAAATSAVDYAGAT